MKQRSERRRRHKESSSSSGSDHAVLSHDDSDLSEGEDCKDRILCFTTILNNQGVLVSMLGLQT